MTERIGTALTRRALLRAAAAGGAATGLASLAAACTPGATSATAAPAASAASGYPTDTLTVVSRADVTTLDVHVRSREALDAVHDSLIARNLDTMQPGPHLATSWKTIDPLTWEFKLRTDVKFHNGEPFNAQVVKFNFTRVLKPELKSSYGASLSPIIASVEAVDDATVRIKTKTPYGLFLERLLTIRMAPQGYYSQNSDDFLATHPLGSGPYRFVEFVPGQRIVIERNEDYWGPRPAFKRITVRIIAEASTALSELLAGNAQVVYDIDADQVDAVSRSAGAEVRSTPNVQCLEVRMDALGRGGPNPFTDKRVRLAASHAIDKDAIAKNLMRGFAKVQGTNIGPLMFGYDPSVQPYPYDPAKAKQLLAEAGYPNGFDTKFNLITISGFGDTKSISEAIVADLAKAGIRCTINQISPQQSTAVTNAGQAGPIFLGANQNGGFFDGGFGFFYLRKSIAASYYYTDALEAQAVKIEGTVDPEEKRRLLSDVQRTLREEAPYIWGWSGTALLAADKRIDVRPYADFPRLATIRPK